MTLLEWQQEHITKLFGTVRYSEELRRHVRQYRSTHIWIPRKNGKTTLIAALAIYLLSMDMPGKATILCGALTGGQAEQIFTQAKGFIKANKWLNNPKIFKIRNGWRQIEHVPTGSILKVVAQGDDVKLGSEPTTIIIDELAVQKSSDFINSLVGGQGSTAEPLFIGISTAGYKNRHKFGYQEWQADKEVFEDQSKNKQHLVFMRPLDEDADWENEEVWKQANPSIGEANSIEFLRGEYVKAKKKPHLIPWFKAYYLNIWGNEGGSWLDETRWYDSGMSGGPVIEELLHGRMAYGGLDLSSKKDLTGWALLFPGSPENADDPGYTVVLRAFMTQWSLENPKNVTADQLLEWQAEGFLTIFDGEEIQYDAVIDQVVMDCQDFNVELIGIDKWGARDLSQRIEKATGQDLIDIKQGYKNLSEPTSQLETWVLDKRLYHGMNPVLKWNVENAVLTRDNFDRVMIHKGKSQGKIDGLAALINAVYVAYEPEEEEQSAFFIPASQFMK
ncbi:phage terminase large subunit-like protein [Saccharothrix ecbatanensis]|uniref:Phage terminase large subunit-like protein n=1 Tax=Saccharothrix ecbatanensis TaxID=1105145 RepID=A0A7W9HLS5_9PSEU|nr:terminase TerL endonuclease subunit [Saccharothrix ecbatanensis]MBB5804663.1 phage terminase large subunit-like protein [Saccharothrix ecbatanensis]